MIIKIEEIVLLFFLYIYNHEYSIRTRPDPRLGFRVLTGSPGQSLFFKKVQNKVVLVKKNQRVATEFLTGFCRVNRVGWVTPGHDFSNFFINPARFQPRVDPPGRAGFQNYDNKYK